MQLKDGTADAVLNPPPHFGVVDDVEHDEHKVIRLFVAHDEIAASLDGLLIETDEDLITLLKLGISVASGSIKVESDDGSDDTVRFAEDAASLSARLPLAAKALRHLYIRRDEGYDIAREEGYTAEIAEFFHGSLSGFKISGDERDSLVADVQQMMQGLSCLDTAFARDAMKELGAILSDTGSHPETGESCTLSSLPMPRLAEWLRRFGEPKRHRSLGPIHGGTPKQKENRRQHELHREMWLRLWSQVREGSPSEAVSEAVAA